MKKTLSALFVLFMLVSFPLHAQNRLKAGKELMRAASSSAGTALLRRMPVNERLSAAISSQVVSSASSAQALLASQIIPGKTRMVGVTDLSLKTSLLMQQFFKHDSRTDFRLFQALMPKNPDMRFSGTVFETTYNGKKEVYGVVATHIFPTAETPAIGMERSFTAIFYKDGIPVAVPAVVVASFPKSMMDISLVKFPEQYEPLLNPFSLGETAPDEEVSSFGFTTKGVVHLTDRYVTNITPFSIRATIEYPPLERAGLCGGAVLNQKGELIGIHVGSSKSFVPPRKTDNAFITPSKYLQTLVEAYHHGGQVTVPFIIQDSKQIFLNIDEEIVTLSLLGSSYECLWEYDIVSRLSRATLPNTLPEYPNARFVEIVTRRIQWTENGKALTSKHSITQQPSQVYIYDLQEEQVVRAYPINHLFSF